MKRYRVNVNKKGLLVTPIEIRRKLGICEGSFVELMRMILFEYYI